MKPSRWRARSSMVAKMVGSFSCWPRRSSSLPECASEATGASELFSSWLMTRMTFFQVCTSCRRSSTVIWRNSSSSCARPLSRKRAPGQVVDLLLVVGADREQSVAAAVKGIAQRQRGLAENSSRRMTFELPALVEQLPGRDIGVDDAVRIRRSTAWPPACSAPWCRAAVRVAPGQAAARAARRQARCGRPPDRSARRRFGQRRPKEKSPSR